jgi:hypothetical protein
MLPPNPDDAFGRAAQPLPPHFIKKLKVAFQRDR